MSQHKLCPLCEEGYLTEHNEQVEIEYRGYTAMRSSLYSTCDVCGAEQADASQTRSNKRDTIAFRKEVDGLLSGDEVRLVRERLGLTQAQAAQAFGGGPVAFSKYESDDVAQSEAMDKLLRLAAKVPGAFEFLAQQSGLNAAKPPVWENMNTILPAKSERPRLHLVHSQPILESEYRKYA